MVDEASSLNIMPVKPKKKFEKIGEAEYNEVLKKTQSQGFDWMIGAIQSD